MALNQTKWWHTVEYWFYVIKMGTLSWLALLHLFIWTLLKTVNGKYWGSERTKKAYQAWNEVHVNELIRKKNKRYYVIIL